MGVVWRAGMVVCKVVVVTLVCWWVVGRELLVWGREVWVCW